MNQHDYQNRQVETIRFTPPVDNELKIKLNLSSGVSRLYVLNIVGIIRLVYFDSPLVLWLFQAAPIHESPAINKIVITAVKIEKERQRSFRWLLPIFRRNFSFQRSPSNASN